MSAALPLWLKTLHSFASFRVIRGSTSFLHLWRQVGAAGRHALPPLSSVKNLHLPFASVRVIRGSKNLLHTDRKRFLTTNFTTSTDKKETPRLGFLFQRIGLIRVHPCHPWLKTLHSFASFRVIRGSTSSLHLWRQVGAASRHALPPLSSVKNLRLPFASFGVIRGSKNLLHTDRKRILTTNFTTSTDKRGTWGFLFQRIGLIRVHPCHPWLKTLHSFASFRVIRGSTSSSRRWRQVGAAGRHALPPLSSVKNLRLPFASFRVIRGS